MTDVPLSRADALTEGTAAILLAAQSSILSRYNIGIRTLEQGTSLLVVTEEKDLSATSRRPTFAAQHDREGAGVGNGQGAEHSTESVHAWQRRADETCQPR